MSKDHAPPERDGVNKETDIEEHDRANAAPGDESAEGPVDAPDGGSVDGLADGLDDRLDDTLDDTMDDRTRAIEATLFAAQEPLSVDAIAAHLSGLEKSEVRTALAALVRDYAGRGVRLVERGKRWHFETAPDLAHILRREREQVRRLSRAATEVLAIIAYHEPVSRAEIEAIRGVQTAKGTLDVLMEAGWVKMAGRREVPGRPVIYATTPEFLDHFGLASRRDLPGLDELRAAGLLDPVDEAFEALSIQEEQSEESDAQGDRQASAPSPSSENIVPGEA